MFKDILQFINLSIMLKRSRNIDNVIKSLQNQFLISLIMMEHVYAQSIMRQNGSVINRYVVPALPKMEKK